MKTQITVWVFATGLLTTAVLADTAAVAPVTPPAPIMVVYAPQLPSVAELSRVATAQGLAITQVIQSARDLNVTYQAANGENKVVSYQLLTDAGSSPAAMTAPTAVYAPPPAAVYYYGPYDSYYPGYWYPSVSVRLGYGFRFRGGRR